MLEDLRLTCRLSYTTHCCCTEMDTSPPPRSPGDADHDANGQAADKLEGAVIQVRGFSMAVCSAGTLDWQRHTVCTSMTFSCTRAYCSAAPTPAVGCSPSQSHNVCCNYHHRHQVDCVCVTCRRKQG